MRKYVYMAIVLAICIWGINTVTIKASDLNKNEEYMSIDDFEINDSIKTLEKNGYRDLNFRHILDEIMSGNVLDVIKECSNVVYQKTVGDFTMVEKALGNLLLIVILSAFFTNFANVFSNDGISSTGFYICYLIVTTMLMTLFENFCLIATDFVRLLLEFLMWHCTGVFPVCGNNRSGGCGRILSAYISYYKCGTIYIFKGSCSNDKGLCNN